DLVDLIERDEDAVEGLGPETAMLRQRLKDPAIVDPYLKVRKTEREERLGGRQNQLHLGQGRLHADNIDVALGELPVAPFLRPLGAPDRSDLHRLQRVRQRGEVV